MGHRERKLIYDDIIRTSSELCESLEKLIGDFQIAEDNTDSAFKNRLSGMQDKVQNWNQCLEFAKELENDINSTDI